MSPPKLMLPSNSKLVKFHNFKAFINESVKGVDFGWAQSELKPELLIDMATLTGACVVGLGEYTSGVTIFKNPLAKRRRKKTRPT